MVGREFVLQVTSAHACIPAIACEIRHFGTFTTLRHHLSTTATTTTGANMPTLLASSPSSAPQAKLPQTTGLRKNGKSWHSSAPRKAFRPTAGQRSYASRAAKQAQEAEVKKHERELRAEKEEERQRRIQALKDKRAAKEEKERYEEMQRRMHAKRVERLRRREKRNKLLKS